MKVGLSLLSQVRSFIGFEIGNGGYLTKDKNGFPVLVRTIDLCLGFLFGWISVSFKSGRVVSLDEINRNLREDVINGKNIGTNE
jgi:hypothetical protein